MIKTETVTINGKEYQRTYSDVGMMIERDGARYSEAVDPLGFYRMYIETDEPISAPDEDGNINLERPVLPDLY